MINYFNVDVFVKNSELPILLPSPVLLVVALMPLTGMRICRPDANGMILKRYLRWSQDCLQSIQQAVEKSLKACLVEQGQKIRKTHSINELVALLATLHCDLDIDEEDCDLLDTIYLPSKYPLGDILPDFSPDRELCQRCLVIAEMVIKKVNALVV